MLILFVYWFMNLNLSEPEQDVLSNDTDTHLYSFYPKVRPVITLFFVVFFYMIVFGIAGGVLQVFLKAYAVKLPWVNSFIKHLMYALSMLLIIRYAIKKSKKQEGSHFSISFKKIPWWLIPVVFVSTLALVVFLERIGGLIPMPVSVQKFFQKAFSKDIFSFITLVILAPILEEIFCRGIVLRGLLKNYPKNKAILVSAIFFAAIHLNPWQALPAFFGGLFMGWMYYKTQSVIPGIIIHVTINGTAFLLMFFSNFHQTFLTILGIQYFVLLCVASTLIFSAGCMLIQKRIPAPLEAG
jgi:uncharacterized protein